MIDMNPDQHLDMDIPRNQTEIVHLKRMDDNMTQGTSDEVNKIIDWEQAVFDFYKKDNLSPGKESDTGISEETEANNTQNEEKSSIGG